MRNERKPNFPHVSVPCLHSRQRTVYGGYFRYPGNRETGPNCRSARNAGIFAGRAQSPGGGILSAIDLRTLLQPEVIVKTTGDYVIVAETEFGEGRIQVGMIVDSVSGVMRVDSERIGPPPDIGTNISSEFIRGIVTLDEAYMILLDFGEIVASVLEKQTGMENMMTAGIHKKHLTG